MPSLLACHRVTACDTSLVAGVPAHSHLQWGGVVPVHTVLALVSVPLFAAKAPVCLHGVAQDFGSIRTVAGWLGSLLSV